MATWQLDKAHTQTNFSAKHMMVTTVRGTFHDVDGTIELDEADPTRSRASFRVGAASFDTNFGARDAHLRSADFFEAERYPEIHFRSTRIARAGKGQFTVTGDLTIRGTTKPVTLTVESGGRGKDPWGGERIGFSMATTINRKDFGLHWNQALEAGGVVVGNEVKISVELELVRSSD